METTKPTLWGIHAGATGDANSLFLAHGYIGIGWPEVGNLVNSPPEWEAFKEWLKPRMPSTRPPFDPHETGQLYRMVHEVEMGHFVAYTVAYHTNIPDSSDLVFLGRIAGPYLYSPFADPAYPHVRRAEWLRAVPRSRFSEAARRELGAHLSLFQIDAHIDEFLVAIAESK